jgi:hypothetical protein
MPRRGEGEAAVSNSIFDFDSAVVQVVTREGVMLRDIRLLGAGLYFWLLGVARRDGFDADTEDNRAEVVGLLGGDLPLPEALKVANCFRGAKADDSDDPALRDIVDDLAGTSLAEWVKAIPDATRRVVSLRVHGVGGRQRELLASVARFTRAQAANRVELYYEVPTDDGGLEFWRLSRVLPGAAQAGPPDSEE